MIIEKHISKLLLEHDCVIVPGFGGFIANYSPAFIHPVHHTFSPPARKLAFNASLRNNDGLLADSIKSGLNISFHEAMELIGQEVADIQMGISRGEQLTLAQIGILFSDREKNIQFKPESGINYNTDSFGLTTFTSPAIKRAGLQEKISRKLMPPQAVRSSRRLPATLKWAAVLLPLATISVWSALNPDKVNGIYQNYASLFPSSDSNEMLSISRPTVDAKTTRLLSPDESNEIAATPVPEPVIVETAVQPAAPDVYFVIAGAFSVQENAEGMVEELKSRGFKASIAGQNNIGLYRVSIEGYNDKDLALQQMESFRNGEFPNAWLLTMR